MKIDTEEYRVKAGSRIELGGKDARYEGGIGKDEAQAEFERLSEELNLLQERLYAEGKRSLLCVFQAMDAAGKDSTIRTVFAPLNPEGVTVTSFKAPSSDDLARDFLWRVHAAVPRRGTVGVWNRSHYEDVLVARVRKLAPEETIKRRYAHIKAFEELISDEGTRVVKFFLNISKEYQLEQFRERLEDPAKLWKFSPGDLPVRAMWDDYMKAYSLALSRCSTERCPWYAIPAERKWFRNLLVARVIRDALRDMKPEFPKPDFNPAEISLE